MEPAPDLSEDEYEPPPHALAQLWGGLVWLYHSAFRERTRWKYVWYVFVLALADLTIADRIFAYLPGRFHPDPRPFLLDRTELIRVAMADQTEFLQKAASMIADAVLLAPVLEELLFRGLPILFARWIVRRLTPKAGRWSVLTIGAASSLLFAWLHNPVLGALPVPILFFAILAWCVAWNWGLRYSILLHMFVNGLIYAELLQQVMMIAG